MLSELNCGEFTITTQTLRNPTDDYTARKVQRDRKKLKIWLHHIIRDRDLILFYLDEQNKEQMAIVTRKCDLPLPDAPFTLEKVGYTENLVLDYFRCFETPSMKPIVVHYDKILKFICLSDRLVEISNGIDWYEPIEN